MRLAIDSSRGHRSDRDNPYGSLAEFHGTNESNILDILAAVFDHQVSGERRSPRCQVGKIDIVQITAPEFMEVIIRRQEVSLPPQLTLSGFSHFHRCLLGRNLHLLSF